MRNFQKTIATLAALLALEASCVKAAVLITAPTASANGAMRITEPITLTITGLGINLIMQDIVFQNWVASGDGNVTQTYVLPNFALSKNGDPLDVGPTLRDNGISNGPDLKVRDGCLILGSNITVDNGDVITIATGVYVLTQVANFNQQTTQEFKGNVYAVNRDAQRISTIASAPEPTSLALLGLAGCGFAVRRPRK